MQKIKIKNHNINDKVLIGKHRQAHMIAEKEAGKYRHYALTSSISRMAGE